MPTILKATNGLHAHRGSVFWFLLCLFRLRSEGLVLGFFVIAGRAALDKGNWADTQIVSQRNIGPRLKHLALFWVFNKMFRIRATESLELLWAFEVKDIEIKTVAFLESY